MAVVATPHWKLRLSAKQHEYIATIDQGKFTLIWARILLESPMKYEADKRRVYLDWPDIPCGKNTIPCEKRTE